MEIVVDLLLLLVLSFLIGLVAHRLQLPIVLGYVIAGIILGPYTPNINIADSLPPGVLVEIGVSLLLFAVGIEFSLKSLLQVRRIAFVGTPLQIVLTTAYGFGLGLLLGWGWRMALWFGLLTSLSSTLLIQQSVIARQIENVEARRVMAAILIMQNLLVVPLAFLFTLLHDEAIDLTTIGLAVLEGSLFLIVLLFVGAQALPRLLALFSGQLSQELRALAVIAVVALVTYATYLVGLPFVLTAFAIGLAMSESDFGRETLHEILRVRALFGFLFYTAAGMLLDIGFLMDNLGTIVLVVVLLSVGKGLILMLVTYLSGYRNGVPLSVGLGLFQVGELPLVLAWLGWVNGILDGNTYSLLMTSILITIVLTPFLLRLTAPLYGQAKALR